MLKPYHTDPEDQARGKSQRAPTIITSFERDIESIEAKRVIRQRRVPSYDEYFVRWKGLPDSKASWEKEEDLWEFADKIEAFESGP
ncbi:unnamed protein product [Amaranthus hypochondriacus]